MADFKAEKWSSLVELAAQETSIAARITGNQYQADATGTSAINTSRVGDISIADYTANTDLSTAQVLAEVANVISLNQKKAFNFAVDDVISSQAAADFEPAAMTQAAKGLALEADKYVLGLYSNASIPAANKIGSVGSSVAITDINIDAKIYEMKEILDVNDAGPERYLVVPSWFMNTLALNGLGTQLGEMKKDGIWEEGEVVRYAGFNIVQSNQVKAVGTGSDEYQIMAFTGRAIPMAATISKIETLRNPKQFGDIIRGLYVFGANVVFPKEVAVLSATK